MVEAVLIVMTVITSASVLGLLLFAISVSVETCPKARGWWVFRDGHDWRRTTGTLYVREPDEFDDSVHARAGAYCRRCDLVTLRVVGGTHTWWGYQAISWDEAMEKARSGVRDA